LNEEDEKMPAVVWKGYISFGLVSFPVRLYAAGRAEAVHFHLLHKKDLSRVKEVWYCVAEDKPIERADMVRGYEVAKGEYVVVEDEELEGVAPETASTMEIVQFVRVSEVDPIYFETSYYVAPGDNITKPYALFLKALKDSKYDAIAKLSMHGREHTVLIRSRSGGDEDGLLLHTLYYPDELHEANKQSISAKVAATKKEIDLATQLIKQLAAPFKPEQFHDTYRENVEKMIAEKQKGKSVTKHAKRKPATVIDLMEALKKSLKGKAAPQAKRTRRTKAA
jgi:DNA end-binding protein Ku